MSTVDQAMRDNLLIALKHLRFAIEEARKNGTVQLGILATALDGGGKIECKFDCEFIEDIAKLIGAEPLSENDRKQCSAHRFLDQHGIH